MDRLFLCYIWLVWFRDDICGVYIVEFNEANLTNLWLIDTASFAHVYSTEMRTILYSKTWTLEIFQSISMVLEERKKAEYALDVWARLP